MISDEKERHVEDTHYIKALVSDCISFYAGQFKLHITKY